MAYGDRPFAEKNLIVDYYANMPLKLPQFTIANVIAEDEFVMAIGCMLMKNKHGITVGLLFAIYIDL